jgi:hypothetical protein
MIIPIPNLTPLSSSLKFTDALYKLSTTLIWLTVVTILVTKV